MSTLGGAVIAAAGLGSRLGHGLPKCMLELEGETILSRLIEVVAPHTDRIHVVVGYREELVIDYVASRHRDVVVVRNPDFRTTQTITSMALGARGLSGQLLFVDGDTVVRRSSMGDFVAASEEHGIVAAVAPARSEDGVLVDLDETERGTRITRFGRDLGTDHEWANMLVAPVAVLDGFAGYVYQALEPRLPLPAARVELAEVDTEQDLVRARAAVSSWDAEDAVPAPPAVP